MSEAYLIAAALGSLQLLSGRSRAEQVRPLLDELLGKTGVPSRRLQELHWLGGDDEYWLSSLDLQNEQAARFQWPAGPLLAHFVLQACSRAVESGERDLILLGQETGGRAVLLLLASPAAVGRHNLAPRVRVGPRLSLGGTGGGLTAAARAALENAGLDLQQIEWLAAGRKLEARPAAPAFPSARWLLPDDRTPGGDLFLFSALADRLEKEKLALLLSQGPQKSGLVTLVERV